MIKNKKMKILVTGAAGFIGFYVAKRLLERGDEVVGLDNINTYYDVRLKHGRLSELGIGGGAPMWNAIAESARYRFFRFGRMNLEDKEAMAQLFATEKFDAICHLAAQAGVRYSIENPEAYICSNITGFFNLLECCRRHPVKHMVYASSSSVYGLDAKTPFMEDDPADHPVSLYAATKRSNELMAHAYSHLYGIPVTGLRFFTVYGPWGRPDMAPFLFMDAILHERPINVFNNGNMMRDFTYIDDIVEGTIKIIDKAPCGLPPCAIYNIGCSNPIKLMDFIATIEKATGKKAIVVMQPMQPGDVCQTYADVSRLKEEIAFCPGISLKAGIEKTVAWYKMFNASNNR
jgi:UDP-glucuronate 4-epimerase